MCSDLLHNISAGYSFGIDGNDEWGVEISETLGIPISEFDCWNTKRPKCASEKCNITFHEECLSQYEDITADRAHSSKVSRAGKTARSLREHLLQTSSGKKLSSSAHARPIGGHLLLKLDVEGSEWGALAHAKLEDLQQMRQIVVEFHRLDFVECHAFFASVVRKVLDAGFAVAHIHGNNWGPMDVLEDGRYMIADALEVTLVNKRALSDAVLQQSRCSSQERWLPEDARNDFGWPDLPLAELPEDGHVVDIPVSSHRMVKYRFPPAFWRVYLPHGIGVVCLCLIIGTIVALLMYKAFLSWCHICNKPMSWFSF